MDIASMAIKANIFHATGIFILILQEGFYLILCRLTVASYQNKQDQQHYKIYQQTIFLSSNATAGLNYSALIYDV